MHPKSHQATARQLEKLIADLEQAEDSPAKQEELGRLRQQLRAVHGTGPDAHGDAWERVLLARHPQRPYTLDYVQHLFTDFTELHGDRRFADDPALVGGLARFAFRFAGM